MLMFKAYLEKVKENSTLSSMFKAHLKEWNALDTTSADLPKFPCDVSDWVRSPVKPSTGRTLFLLIDEWCDIDMGYSALW